MRPDPLAILDEEPHHRQQRNRYERQQAVPPTQSEGDEHLPARQGQQATAEAAEDGVGGHRGRGVAGERVDEVGAERHEDGDHGQAHEEGSHDGHDPLHLVLCGPAVDDETYGHQDGAWQERGQSCVRRLGVFFSNHHCQLRGRRGGQLTIFGLQGTALG